VLGTSVTGTAVGVVLLLPTLINDSCHGAFPSPVLSSNFLSLVCVSDLDICEAIKLL
jgi:hypothetical protein